MSQKRERQRARESSKDEDQYIILVKDIPRQCRWQELKDMTRLLGGEQSLKAEVFELEDGSQMGHCTIKGRSAADKVYENFCTQGWHGLPIRVSLAVLEKHGILRILEGPKQCYGSIEARGVAPSSSPGATVHPSRAMDYSPPYAAITTCQERPGLPPVPKAVAPIYSPSISSLPQSFPSRSRYPPASMPPPSPYTGYPISSRSKPTLSSSTIHVPIRPIDFGSTIFIAGLSYSQSEPQLRDLLQEYGSVNYLEIHPDSRQPGKFKGTARARFKTHTEALNAIRGLDGQYLGSHKISVQQAKEEPSSTTPSMAAVTPLFEVRRSSSETKRGALKKKKKNVGVDSSTTKINAVDPRLPTPPPSARLHSRGGSDELDVSNGSFSSKRPLIVDGARKSTSGWPSGGEGRSCQDDDDE